MISSFSFFLLVSASKHENAELGLMLSKSLMASVPNHRPPMSFQTGLLRRGRSYRRDGSDDQVCYLHKTMRDSETIVNDNICGDHITRRYLVDSVKCSCINPIQIFDLGLWSR